MSCLVAPMVMVLYNINLWTLTQRRVPTVDIYALVS